MIQGQFNLKGLRINYGGYTKDLDHFVKFAFREAIKEFVRGALRKIPVYTGAAASTLEGLANSVGIAVLINPSTEAKGVKTKQKQATYWVSGNVYSRKYKPRQVGYTYTWRYELDTSGTNRRNFDYFGYLDKNKATRKMLKYFHLISKTPWGATEAGMDRFLKQMKYLLTNYVPYYDKNNRPKLSDYIVRGEASFVRGSAEVGN